MIVPGLEGEGVLELGGAPLAVGALDAFDADIDYRANLVRTGKLPFTNLRLRLGLDNRLLSLSPLAFTDLCSAEVAAQQGPDSPHRVGRRRFPRRPILRLLA